MAAVGTRPDCGRGIEMSIDALAGIRYREWLANPEHVAPMGHGLQVVRVNARWVSAEMVDFIAFRDRSAKHLI
jgi:hypothetical protein